MAVSARSDESHHAAGAAPDSAHDPGSMSGAGPGPKRLRAAIVIALLLWVVILCVAGVLAFRGEPIRDKRQDRIPPSTPDAAPASLPAVRS